MPTAITLDFVRLTLTGRDGTTWSATDAGVPRDPELSPPAQMRWREVSCPQEGIGHVETLRRDDGHLLRVPDEDAGATTLLTDPDPGPGPDVPGRRAAVVSVSLVNTPPGLTSWLDRLWSRLEQDRTLISGALRWGLDGWSGAPGPGGPGEPWVHVRYGTLLSMRWDVVVGRTPALDRVNLHWTARPGEGGLLRAHALVDGPPRVELPDAQPRPVDPHAA